MGASPRRCRKRTPQRTDPHVREPGRPNGRSGSFVPPGLHRSVLSIHPQIDRARSSRVAVPDDYGMGTVNLGARGEAIAADWLERHGYVIVDRNWRCARGRVDIVARSADDLVFVEVKTRAGPSTGHPLEAVTRRSSRVSAELVPAWFAAHPDHAARRSASTPSPCTYRSPDGGRARRGDRMTDIGRASAVALLGVSGRLVEVEAHLTSQLPALQHHRAARHVPRRSPRTGAVGSGERGVPAARATDHGQPDARRHPQARVGLRPGDRDGGPRRCRDGARRLGAGRLRRRARTRRTGPSGAGGDPDDARGAGRRHRAGGRPRRQPGGGTGGARRHGARRRLAPWRGHRRGRPPATGRRRARADGPAAGAACATRTSPRSWGTRSGSTR